MIKGFEPTVKTEGIGTTLLKVTGVGLLAGVALVVATNEIMKKVAPSQKED